MLNFFSIIILITIIILAYIFLFWVLKGFSEIIIEYNNENKEGKKGIIFAFILYSCFIITPSYIIFCCFCKILEFLYS